MKLFELTFGLEPRTIVNKSTDMDIEYSEDFDTEIYQRMKACHQIARETMRKSLMPLKSQ